MIGHIRLNLTLLVRVVRMDTPLYHWGKDFIEHIKSVEEAKKSGTCWGPLIAELELIWNPREAKLEDVVELG